MKAKEIIEGTRVSFLARGKGRVTGVVTRTLVKRRGLRLARRWGMPAPSTEVAEVAVDDYDNGYYTVPFYMLKVIGKVRNVVKARLKVNTVKNNIRSNNWERSNKNYKIADDKKLFDLKRGDMIKVEYRGGYCLDREFAKLARPSFNVGYFQNGKIRFTPPQFVKMV